MKPWVRVKIIYKFHTSINIQRIDCYLVLRGYNAAFFGHCWFLLFFFMMGLLLCEYEPVWQEDSVESMWIIWPLRPLVKNILVCIQTCNKSIVDMIFIRILSLPDFLNTKDWLSWKLRACKESLTRLKDRQLLKSKLQSCVHVTFTVSEEKIHQKVNNQQ